MAWTSTEEIAKSLGLAASADDYDSLKRELRMKLSEIHPDKNGGAFSSPQDEEHYNQVSSAYEFVSLASRESTALIPVTQLPAIIKAVRDAQLAPTQQQVGQLRSECRDESRLDRRGRYALPRIGSGVFAAVCTFLFTFSGALAEHPILGPLSKNTTIQMSLLALAAYAGVFFLLTWGRERREEALAEHLMSETARLEIFERLLKRNRKELLDGRAPRQFSIRNVIDVITERWGGHRSFHTPMHVLLTVFFARAHITPSLAEKIAQIHLLELEKRGAIHRVEAPSMDALYEFDESLVPI